MSKIRILSGNQIKIIAAVFMLIDHMGLILFPRVLAFRIIGRLSFPLFAFMIAEGARYTKNRLRYFLTMSILGVGCQLPLIILFKSFDFNVFITFSLSIVSIYALDLFKRTLFGKSFNTLERVGTLLMFLLCIVSISLLEIVFKGIDLDYGFLGCMMPVFASAINLRDVEGAPPLLKRLDILPVRIAFMCFPMLLYSIFIGGIQYFALLSVPILFMYSGKRGEYNMKYFFYIFYPAHLVILQLIAWIFL